MVQWCNIMEVSSMAYFLKKSKQQNRVYLSIYESFYSPETNGTKHKCFKSLGNTDKLIESGIEDPIAYYENVVKEMNESRKAEKQSKKEKDHQKQISDDTPERLLGYFPLCHILNNLDVEEHFDFMQSNRKFRYSTFDIFRHLVYARVVSPGSKYRTYHDVLPKMCFDIPYSYDQSLDALEFIGSNYEKYVEIFTEATKENYGIKTSHTFFDCTNFYFEIDKETDFLKHGPSKENRHDPIVGLGLLLDANMIPIGMKMYPGNESEKPILRDIIHDLKNQNNINGRTIQIADKGLNCAKNIIDAKNNGDGYIFSKSIKQLPQKELNWVFNDEPYHAVCDYNGTVKYKYKSCVDEFEYTYIDSGTKKKYKKIIKERRIVTFNPKLREKKLYEINKMIDKAINLSHSKAKKQEYGESSRYINFTSQDGEKAIVTLNNDMIERDKKLAGYNMLVTSEYKMSEEEIYEAYHNLWRIEETFRTMKSELDARPAYVRKEDTIKGHFLVCYVSILLVRLLQFKDLNNKYSTSEICKFMKTFKLIQYNDKKYINISKKSDILYDLGNDLNLPITNYYLTGSQIKKMQNR